MEAFQLNVLSFKKNYYIKQVFHKIDTNDENWHQNVKPSFISVTPEFFALCFKHYYEIEIDRERDMRASYDFKKNCWNLIDLSTINLQKVTAPSPSLFE